MKSTKINAALLPLWASLLVAAVVPTGAALAQQGEIEEIVVTARQREETLRDVPATVTVLTEQQLARAGVQRA